MNGHDSAMNPWPNPANKNSVPNVQPWLSCEQPVKPSIPVAEPPLRNPNQTWRVSQAETSATGHHAVALATATVDDSCSHDEVCPESEATMYIWDFRPMSDSMQEQTGYRCHDSKVPDFNWHRAQSCSRSRSAAPGGRAFPDLVPHL